MTIRQFLFLPSPFLRVDAAWRTRDPLESNSHGKCPRGPAVNAMNNTNCYGMVLLIFCLAMSGCTFSPVQQDSWPEDIPAREWFLTRYLTDAENLQHQRQQEYLRWVARFYYGWLAHPTGWNRVTETVVASVDEESEVELKRRLMLLGRRVAGEWAKESSGRVIDDRLVATWLKVLPLAADSGNTESVLVHIAADVDALFAGKLAASAVSVTRYVAGHEDIAAFER